MTPENKKVVKIIALSLGAIIVLAVITILIVKQVQKGREAREESRISDGGDSAPAKSNPTSSGGGYSTSSFGGRTFSKTEIEKMQSFLFNMGAMAMNDTIVSAIRDSGGIDGKIGTGFKTAYNEAIKIGIIKSLDDLYTQAMKLM